MILSVSWIMAILRRLSVMWLGVVTPVWAMVVVAGF
jgi:hypothetical protein